MRWRGVICLSGTPLTFPGITQRQDDYIVPQKTFDQVRPVYHNIQICVHACTELYKAWRCGTTPGFFEELRIHAWRNCSMINYHIINSYSTLFMYTRFQ